jgi:hypothetical protein
MHNMKKLTLSVFIFTFGFATATHAQQVNTLFTKQLPEAPNAACTDNSKTMAGQCDINGCQGSICVSTPKNL